MTTVQLAQDTTIPPEDLIDQVPSDVLDRLPDDVVERIQDGVIDQIPEEVVDRLPESVVNQIPDGLLESAAANPGLLAVLVIVGLLAAAGFVYGIVKSAIKAALFFGVVAAAAWFWFFNAA